MLVAEQEGVEKQREGKEGKQFTDKSIERQMVKLILTGLGNQVRCIKWVVVYT